MSQEQNIALGISDRAYFSANEVVGGSAHLSDCVIGISYVGFAYITQRIICKWDKNTKFVVFLHTN